MIRTGHRPEDWRDEGPAYGGSVRLGGSLVVGGTEKHAKEATARERKAAAARQRRYMERQKSI